MTKQDQDKAIRTHLAAHEAKIERRRKARISSDNRKKDRGLADVIERMNLALAQLKNGAQND